MASSTVYTIFLSILAVLLCSTKCNGGEYDAFCSNLRQSEVACVNVNTLVQCVEFYGSWYGIMLGDCGNLCCDASIPGCRINCAASTTSTTSTTTTPKPKLCSIGELEKVEGTCSSYNYCSNGEWVTAKCPVGIFDAGTQSCVFGTCSL